MATNPHVKYTFYRQDFLYAEQAVPLIGMFLVDIEQSASRDFLVLREERFSSHSEFTKLLIVVSIYIKLLE